MKCFDRAPNSEPRHGSDGSGWGSEQSGLARAWWRLSHGSIRAQTEVQWMGLETLNWGAGNGSSTGSRRRLKLRAQGQGGGCARGGGNMK